MSMDVKLSKAQLSKLIQSGGFLGALLGKYCLKLLFLWVKMFCYH